MQSLYCFDRKYLASEIDGFSLPGVGKSHYWCGIWQTFGCLNHKQAYIRQYKRTCFRPNCKVCYLSWASRQSNRTVRKLNQMKKNNKLQHAIITLSVSWSKSAKKDLIKSLKQNGIEASCIIYTPFDESNDGKFFLKTTLHVFYYGRIQNCKADELYKIYPQDDLDGSNKTLFKILQTTYLNCGIRKGTHPVSWIGRSQYCKLESEKPTSNGRNCPLCNKKLKLIYFSGEIHPLEPDESFSGVLEKNGWKYCLTDSIWTKLYKKIKRQIRKTKSRISLTSVIIQICSSF